MPWQEGSVRPVSLESLGQQLPALSSGRCRTRRKRWPGRCGAGDNWRRWWPACVRGEARSARWLQTSGSGAAGAGLTSLSVRVLEVDERAAKAAILGLNRGQRATRELEEAWIVQALVREDGLTQVEAGHLLGRHKSWVCRRLALLERLSEAVKEDLRLGLVGPSLARQLTRLPAGNQEALLALTRRETLTAQEVSGVIGLLEAASEEQAAFVLARPREALQRGQGLPRALRDPRLSRAGNWLARHLTRTLEALVGMENWLRTPNERELRARDREILRPLLDRVGDQASVVAELVLGPDLDHHEPAA